MIMYKKRDLYRGLAVVIDSFVVFFIYNNLLSGFLKEESFNLQLLVFLGYYVFFDLINNGASLGKMTLGVSVSTTSSLQSRLKHTFLKIISIFISPVTIVVYLVKGKILHDYLEREEVVSGDYL